MTDTPTIAPAPAAANPLDTEVRAALDAAIADLTAGSRTWTHLTLGQRARLLQRLHRTVSAVAEEWADTAATSKGLRPGHPLRGEEWLAGPYATLVSLDAYRDSLRALAKGTSPAAKVRTDAAPGGRTRLHVFPLSPVDGVLLSGYTGEIWLEPGVTAEAARREAGLGQLTPGDPGGVGLVLGAGNVTSIPVLDVMYELLAHNRVALLKVNPTQDALVPVFERALAPLIELGLVRIVTGGGDVGAYLTQHPGIAHVHITGAAPTFDAIVWGPSGPAAGAEERSTRKPVLDKPITAELGGVSPIIVVPGVWSDADLRFHAEHIATMRLQNSGHNCIAGQVVLVSAEWPQRAAFLAALKTAYAAVPERPVWYPRSAEKLAAATAQHPDATWIADGTRAIVEVGLGSEGAADLERTEYFSPVLGVVELPGRGQAFLDTAVAHANDRLAGTLGANVLIDPATQKSLGAGFERALADLRYGNIAVNTWTAFGFLTPTMTWGGFPGATIDRVESGIGVVHNALLIDRVERSIARGPFRPFPRSVTVLGRGRFSVLPKPPWFATSRTGAVVSEGFTRFRMDGNWIRLAGTLLQAFRA
ncbi:aldehyde dehydrogenase family protein [Microbacterium terricola]|uniref:Aldehyde dehydrogenase n=1 Tax=Microbacterium terricola TaxID=344163 RepID=A0ABM8DVN9_9MICO|nr:aldehyde dehydrogenase family protein [Microbacterium terricola]UYK39744.1 aldehyde dehydrogenase family protein [Microbacterium terricola]BDV29506.1 putative aldehyde dehydrogenase [Microbacterium terricola]